jgi:peptide/nickel transport system permease protein
LTRFVLKRALWAIPTLFIASVLVFIAVRSSTDPLAALARNPRASPEELEEYRRSLGLDKSLPMQYWTWLKSFVMFDWGKSLSSRREVWPDLKRALANTIVLGTFAFIITISVGVTLGIISALRQYSKFDNISTGFSFFSLSIPQFWFALILQLFFAITLTKWFNLDQPFLPVAGVYPPGHEGFDPWLRVKHLILPALVVAFQGIAIYSRYMRASMLEVMNSDYMRTARSKGISEKRVIMRHGFRNALLPVVTYAALDIGAIVGGLVITEAIFEYPGMGRFFIDAYNNGDYTQILPWMMVVVFSVILFNLLADLAYGWLDPRIRLD